MAHSLSLSSQKTCDRAVRGTNDDATVSKLSCVQLGYFEDDFLKYFVRRASKRAPIINRGYYARVSAFRTLVQQFLDTTDETGSNPEKQIISLGCGFDTGFFQLKARQCEPKRYIEVDFPEVVAKKADVIANEEVLRQLVKFPPVQDGEFHGGGEEGGYSLVAADLRDLDACIKALSRANYDPSLPTLVLAECVLVYLPSDGSQALLQWAAKEFSQAAIVIYEMINAHDAFGEQMIINLEMRGCPLLGLAGTPDLEAQRSRLTSAGWKRSEGCDMRTIYENCLDPVDVRRISRLELFDEFEEWNLIMAHYCIAYGVNDPQGLLASFGLRLHPSHELQQRKVPSKDLYMD
ncbi:hypothetical protein CYMTET_54823 [Cymbomonas tetramitiformis]|uniref:Leucine carboxyl methyltransferase 1 homolog n=1 Tax=Cymbomonas tetramitiformis TaxID=36881 RepID=A0AAE0BFB7_9CHLO|nr:hypothetical protein CYMTET_54823 [Cymbomonas tetramitiformis]